MTRQPLLTQPKKKQTFGKLAFNAMSVEEAHRIFHLEPSSGVLRWKARTADMFVETNRTAEWSCHRWNARWSGKEATSLSFSGYRRCWVTIGINPSFWVAAHRIVWALYTGKWPDGEIDHINHDRADNRISNLRDISKKENAKNKIMRSDNASGVCGVSKIIERGHWRGYWQAGIGIDGKRLHLGRFTNFDDAINARKTAERQYGFHENHGVRE